MEDQELLGLLAALLLASVHLFSGRMTALEAIPRSHWLSAAGGVSIAYVFAHLLPELAEGQRAVAAAAGQGSAASGPLLEFLEPHVWLVALLGLAIFYGVESHSVSSRRCRRQQTGEDQTGDDAFWLSIVSFAVYNAIVGYLLLSDDLDEPQALVLFTVALAIHFLINDISLRDHHKEPYRRVGRWLVAAAVLAGCVVGVTTDVAEPALALVLAFVAGGIVLNVLKEELPSERRARFWPFAVGAVLYTVLLQLA